MIGAYDIKQIKVVYGKLRLSSRHLIVDELVAKLDVEINSQPTQQSLF